MKMLPSRRWRSTIAASFLKVLPDRDVEGQLDQRGTRGGARAAIFVCVMWGLDILAFLGNAVSLVIYFIGYMNFSLTKSATALTNFMGTGFALALLGGFISDTYLSRFTTCLLSGCIELAGYILLMVQAWEPSLRPTPCQGMALMDNGKCERAKGGQLAILYAGLYLVAIGVGGIRAALPTLGADQFEREPKKVSSFFNWFLFSLTVGAIFGQTFLVWVSTNLGWRWGFGLCALSICTGVLIISAGKPFYINKVPDGKGPIVRILQVFVAASRNWRLPVPNADDNLHEILMNKKMRLMEVANLKRTDQLRFLDKAAIIKNHNTSESSWYMCTVTQVEETKIIIRMLPIILSTIFVNTCLAQLQTFSVQQGVTMDPNLLGFRIPAPSLPVIPFLFIFFIVPLYDRIVVPLIRKFTGIPTGIRQLQRIGVGLVLSAISMAIAGIVETRRKNVAFKHNMVDSRGPLPMSVFWLAFQYAVFGAADMFTLAGILEFFYSESSEGMKSLGISISWCSLALGYFLSSAVVAVVNEVSGGWLANNNLNRDKLDYFYWLLAGLSVLNFGFYLVCASWYKYKKVESKQEVGDNEDEGRE